MSFERRFERRIREEPGQIRAADLAAGLGTALESSTCFRRCTCAVSA